MEKEMPDQSKIYQLVTNRIVEQLQDHLISYDKPWVSVGMDGQMAHNAETGNRYKGVNQFMLGDTVEKKGYLLNQWLTFKQIKTLGGSVRKGEKASHVIAYVKEYKDTQGVKYDEKDMKEMDVERKTELGIIARSYVVSHPVFNVFQTQGLPEKYYHIPSTPLPGPFEIDEKAEKLLSHSGAKIEYEQRNAAFYSPEHDVIKMPVRAQFNGKEPFYETALHELGHWTGHESRLDRFNKRTDEKQYAQEELVAELTSAFLCAELGFSKPITNNAAYIKSWLEKLEGDKRYIVKAAAQAEKAAEYVWHLHRQKERDNEVTRTTDIVPRDTRSENATFPDSRAEVPGRLFSENYALYLHQKELARKQAKGLSLDER